MAMTRCLLLILNLQGPYPPPKYRRHDHLKWKRKDALEKIVLEGEESAQSALQMCFRSSSPFNVIHQAKRLEKETKTINGSSVTLPKRVTWSLRRTGRVRMPYAAALLRDYLAIQGRDAFDLDFTKEAAQPSPSCVPAAVSCG